MTQVSSADGRLILTCDALNIGGYGSAHRVTTYTSPLPNVGDIWVYVGGSECHLLPASSVAGAVNDLRIEGNAVNSVVLATGSRSIGIGFNTTETNTSAAAAMTNVLIFGVLDTASAAATEDNFVMGGSALQIGAGVLSARRNVVWNTGTASTVGAGASTFDDNWCSHNNSRFEVTGASTVSRNFMLGEGMVALVADGVMSGNLLWGTSEFVSVGAGGIFAGNVALSCGQVSVGTASITSCLLAQLSIFDVGTNSRTLASSIILNPGDLVYPAGGSLDQANMLGVTTTPNEENQSFSFNVTSAPNPGVEVFRMRSDANGNYLYHLVQAIPVGAAYVLSAAELVGGWVLCATGAALALTLPTGVAMDALLGAVGSQAVGQSFTVQFVVNALTTITLVDGVDFNVSGLPVFGLGKSGVLTARRLAAGVWIANVVASA